MPLCSTKEQNHAQIAARRKEKLFTDGISLPFPETISGISMSAKNKRPAIALNNSVTSTPVKPSAKQVKVNDETESDLKKIYDLIALMNSKLDKLDQIEIHLARVDQDIKDLKHSYTFVNETADELKRNQITQDNAIKSLEESITTIKGQNLQLHQEVIDVRAHSMRSNLVFYNLPEEDKEDPFATVRDVLTNKMAIDENKEIEIERAHRLGRKRDDGKPRPIVAKFLRYQDKEFIRKSAYLLKGTKLGIAEQFPKEIAETRKKMYPIMKKAKEDGNAVKLIKDKLFISGQ